MATFPIKVERIKGKGRGLVATKDLKAGDILLTEEPYAFCLSPFENKCDYCLSDKKTPLRCSKCKLQKYCNVSCQKTAWVSHKEECKNLPKLMRKELIMRPEMILLFTRLLRKIQKEKKQVRRQARTDGFPQSINDLESLYEHCEEKHKVRCEMERIELESFLGKKIEEKEFNHLASRVYTNSLAITGPLIDWLGPAIYLKASLINNSCDFNSVPVCFGKTLIIRAVRTIMKGEEITATYTDVLEPTFMRRHILREKFCFTCNCTRCENKELDAKMQSILCEKCKGQVLRKNYKTFMKCSACDHLPSQKHTSAVLAIEAEIESFLKIRMAKPISNDINFRDALELAGRQKYILHPLHYLRVKTFDRVHVIGLNMKKIHEILPYLQEVVSAYEIIHPIKDSSIGIYCARLGEMYIECGRFEEACKYLIQALAIFRVTNGVSHILYQQTIERYYTVCQFI